MSTFLWRAMKESNSLNLEIVEHKSQIQSNSLTEVVKCQYVCLSISLSQLNYVVKRLLYN